MFKCNETAENLAEDLASGVALVLLGAGGDGDKI